MPGVPREPGWPSRPVSSLSRCFSAGGRKRDTGERRKQEETAEEGVEKVVEGKEKWEDDQRRGGEDEEDEEDEEDAGFLFDPRPSRTQYFLFCRDRGRGRRNRQVIRSRCVHTGTPTCLDRPRDEEESDLAILELTVVWAATLETSGSIVKVANFAGVAGGAL